MLLPVSLKEGPDLPEDRPGQPEWDPFFREGRGKKSREARKQKRAAIPDVQKRRESGLEEGCPEHHQDGWVQGVEIDENTRERNVGRGKEVGA